MKNWLGVVFKVAVSALVLAVVVWQLDIRSVMQTLATISMVAAICAGLVLLGQSLLAAERLVKVVARFGMAFPFWDCLKVTLEGMFFSQTFVSFLGGDALRIWRIRQNGLPLTDATSAVLLDRLIGILVNHFFLLVSIPWLWTRISDQSVRYALLVLGLSGIMGFALILLLGLLRGRGGYLHRLRSRIPFRRLTIVIVEASTVGRHFLTQYPQLAYVAFISALMTLANMAMFALILSGMGVNLPLVVGCALLVPAILEIAMLPISIAGWGLREGAAVVAFASLGLSTDQALGASLASGLIGAIISLLGGVLWLSDRRKTGEISMLGDKAGLKSGTVR
jgi:uncharacterized protein (TIRG00374 family)